MGRKESNQTNKQKGYKQIGIEIDNLNQFNIADFNQYWEIVLVLMPKF